MYDLGSVPPEVLGLTEITTLELDGNRLSEVPAELGELTNLTRLCFSSNKVWTICPYSDAPVLPL